ncbi:MAG: hypothetical protein ACRERC_02710, partial [Candidatus Binatia bacterium]
MSDGIDLAVGSASGPLLGGTRRTLSVQGRLNIGDQRLDPLVVPRVDSRRPAVGAVLQVLTADVGYLERVVVVLDVNDGDVVALVQRRPDLPVGHLRG